MEAYRYPSPRRPVAPVPVPVLRVDTLSRQVSKLSRGSSRRSRSTQQTQQQEQQEPGNGPYSFADYARRLDTYRQRWGRAPLERISEFNHFVDERFACFEGTPVSEFAPSNFSSTLNVPLSAVEESKTELIEPTPEQEEGKYVTGLALVLLLIGLSLSVFLIALDMVCLPCCGLWGH